MGLKADLAAEVKSTFSSQWDVQTSLKVPAPEDLRLNANHAKDLEQAVVLYADLDGSTNMVDSYDWWFSAEIYKSFLRCAAAVVKSEAGTITAYDGDRIMAVFTGDAKCTDAVRCAMKIAYAVEEIVQPAIIAQYPNSSFVLKHVVGVDVSQLRTSRIGVRGDNDLVWIGRAANYAAKLTNLSGYSTWITGSVYKAMNNSVKFVNSVDMWEHHQWTTMNNMSIYRSNYRWTID